MIEDVVRMGEHFPRFLWEILMAIICGGLIGVEREMRGPGGLRNNVLICLGAVLYMVIAELMTLTVQEKLTLEPLQMATHVVLGAAVFASAVVISYRGDPSGIGRAGILWVVAAIGLLIGAGHPMFGLLVTGITLLTLTLANSLEDSLRRRSRPLLLKLTVREDTSEFRTKLKTALERHNIHADNFRSENSPQGVKITITAPKEPESILNLIAELWTYPGITEVEH